MVRLLSVTGGVVLLLSLMVSPSSAALQVFDDNFLWDTTNQIYWLRDTNLSGSQLTGTNTLAWIDALNNAPSPDTNPGQINAWRLPTIDEMWVMNDYLSAYQFNQSYTAAMQDSQGNLNIQTGAYWATPFTADSWGMGMYQGYAFDLFASRVTPLDWGPNFAWLVTDMEPVSVTTPLPGSVWLVASGVMGLVAFRRRMDH